MSRKASIDLTEGPILRKVMLFALPLLLNSVINQLYTTADTVMMGQFAGTMAMAAVGASAQPIHLLVNMFIGLSLGVTVSCGNFKGGQKHKELSECMHTAVILGFLIGVAVLLFGLFLSEPLLRAMNTPAEILEDATLYVKIRLSSGPVWILALFCISIFHAHGEARIPTFVSIFSGLVNVGLNVVFVPVMGMGVEGVALATDISLGIKALVYCIILFSPKGQFRLTLSGLRLRWRYVKSIFTIGIPNGLSSIVFSFSNVLLQTSINRFGSLVVAGNTAATELINYTNLILAAIRSACVSTTAQCCGAHKLDRVGKLVKTILPSGIALLILLDIPITLFGKALMAVIADSAEAAELGFSKLMFNCWGYNIFLFVKVFSGGLAGMRKTTLTLLCDLFGIILPRILWVWFVVPHMQTPDMIYAIYPITWLLTTILTGSAFYHHLRKLKQEQLLTTSVP